MSYGSSTSCSLPAVLLACCGLSSCAPSLDRIARSHELEHQLRTGTNYEHVVLSRRSMPRENRLHIYIEGDGVPWMHGRVPSSDPTPRNPIALKLMTRDGNDSVYIGRPCYFGTAASKGCNSDIWTFDRYSTEVVDSMVSVIETLKAEGNYEDCIIFGYSGGGVIARLVAPRVSDVVAVVTVAANLDTDKWTDLHRYLPLSGSLNPADAEPLPAEILHFQLVGDEDDVVPPAVTDSYRQTGQTLGVWTYEGFDHVCCWQDMWPEVLGRVENAVALQREDYVNSGQFHGPAQ